MPISISGQTRIPSTLKWLLTEHAALLGDIKAITGRQGALTKQLLSIECRQRKLQADALVLEQALAVKQAAAAALNTTCQLAFSSVEPIAGGVVNAWAGKYGKRGALKAYVRDVLESASPRVLTTTEVVNQAIGHFGLVVLTPSERTTFRLLVSGYLRKMLNQGLVNALHRNPEDSSVVRVPNTSTGLWEWKPPMTLAALADKAAAIRRIHSDSADAPAGRGAADPNSSRREVAAQ